MNFDAANLLQVITLALSGWTLREVVQQGKVIAAMRQKLKDLPCGKCGGDLHDDE